MNKERIEEIGTRYDRPLAELIEIGGVLLRSLMKQGLLPAHEAAYPELVASATPLLDSEIAARFGVPAEMVGELRSLILDATQ